MMINDVCTHGVMALTHSFLTLVPLVPFLFQASTPCCFLNMGISLPFFPTSLKSSFSFSLFFPFLLFQNRVSLCRPVCPGISSADQADLKFTAIYLPLLPKCWDCTLCRHHPARAHFYVHSW